jgi:ribonuclease HI
MCALHELRRMGAESVLLHSDNRIVVDQLGESGTRPAPIARLAPLFDAAHDLIGSFASVRVLWIPRHRNGEADALAREAQGLPARPVNPPRLSKARRKNG